MRKNGDKLQRITVFIAGAAMSIGAAFCSYANNNMPPTATDAPKTPTMALSAVLSPSHTSTPIPTESPNLTPKVTASATVLEPSMTPTATETETPTPAIIEITAFPVPGSWTDDWIGLPDGAYFVPVVNINIRQASREHPPSDNDRTNPVLGQVYAYTEVPVFTEYRMRYSGNSWFCLDEVIAIGGIDKEYWCERVISYEVDGAPWGSLWLP